MNRSVIARGYWLAAILILLLAQISCQENRVIVPTEAQVTVLQSTPECQNVIIIELHEGNQYFATVSSDIPVYNDIRFSGIYQQGKTFIILGDIAGNHIKLNLHQTESGKEMWILDGMSEEESLNSGWLLE